MRSGQPAVFDRLRANHIGHGDISGIPGSSFLTIYRRLESLQHSRPSQELAMPNDIQTRYDGIIIRQRSANESGMFPTLVTEALAIIDSKPVGKKLLSQIVALKGRAKFGYTVCIMRPANLSLIDTGDGTGPQWSGGSLAVRVSEANASDPTVGTPTAVTWNANVISTPDGSRPSFIALAHELIHALYNLKGEAFADTPMEEYCTVGLPPVANKREITENKIRKEHNLPRRDAYSGLKVPVLA